MVWTAEWRTKGDSADAVLVLDDSGKVYEALTASQPVLSRFLTDMADLAKYSGESSVGGEDRNPETWGELVIRRAISGEVIEVEPELFWHGIYTWFRSHGVDYDTPGAEDSPLRPDMGKPQKSVLMDD
jgi:hypothetical protein